ncbi:ABC transporter permease [Hoyosella rhizosphaerae]|uniref:ABC transporter permease n=1 Tax=Hoyosella rhizosphaerae TaxID=1755582 RepID=A0A916XIZ5_9ACTN|nr:ABC transporter permease [Hoyosella rhizosphaerae]MBN4925460.1 ABC transporter permease [Hoyosella rhizosphaerae]GGC75008.1 ABC transporter permease [Hoyosella rhizosphaerae]
MSAPQTTRRIITLVALREFRAQVRTKTFVIGNIITLALIIGGMLLFAAFRGDGEPDPIPVGVTSEASAETSVLNTTATTLGMILDLHEVNGPAEARALVDDGTVDASVLGREGTSIQVYSDSELSTELAILFESAANTLALQQTLNDQGIDPATFAEDTAAGIQVDVANPADPETGQRTIIAIAVIYLIFGLVFGSGMYVAMGVVEEKSSRVVEILLSTIKPLQLLWGKVIGIGAAGLVQVVTYAVVALVTARATGLLEVSAGEALTFLSLVFWAILGYLFFALLYAAAGSLVSRQEEVQSVQMPIMMFMFACIGASVATFSNPTGTFATLAAWIPPLSAFAMPIRIAIGEATVVEMVGAATLMIIACAIISIVAARIYTNSVLRVGARVSWKEAFTK